MLRSLFPLTFLWALLSSAAICQPVPQADPQEAIALTLLDYARFAGSGNRLAATAKSLARWTNATSTLANAHPSPTSQSSVAALSLPREGAYAM